ncbi:diguanylate cyclase [Acinetobacter qingfengensis]|uniref:diguanylate cyclase n=1 Tax=Acinetobacter qingfengensis TaxID=1262585 RepID=A0A1E7REX1_9GAMM|nr:diguanylate cyclase [Acinetobacter qingfengensis]KAA8731175.1 diguanylate cyclase [Acinetobacter qingfengensis]OEY97843.1 hypothetical protein BJI46_08060 [Acinetobacter qingfengensis]
MSKVIIDQSYKRKIHRSFLLRMFIMRQLGTSLCFLSISSVLVEMNYPSWVLFLLGVNALLWPSIAYFCSSNHPYPIKTEYRLLSLDGLAAGVWVAVMGLSPFPSLIILAILLADRYAAGGLRLLKNVVITLTLGFFVTWIILGFPINFKFQPHTVLMTLPLATIYLLALSVVLRQIFVTLEQKTKELEQLALTDTRLQIANRRHFESCIEEIFNQDNKKRHTAYLLIIDIDHFKRVNDNYGHEIGDALLMTISTIIRKTVNTHDIPARFGGDELAIIAFRNNVMDIKYLAEEILKQIHLVKLEGHDSFYLSASIGIAPVGDVATSSEWFRKADQALYHVKRSGRNGIFISQ